MDRALDALPANCMNDRISKKRHTGEQSDDRSRQSRPSQYDSGTSANPLPPQHDSAVLVGPPRTKRLVPIANGLIRDRSDGGITAPPDGLYLESMDLDVEELEVFEP